MPALPVAGPVRGHPVAGEIHLYNPCALRHAAVVMMKKLLPWLLAPLLLGGCATTFTNLTPRQQVRNANHLYPVEVAFTTRQQSLRWETMQAFINVGSDFLPMRQTRLMSNRWEGLVPVARGTNVVHYRYKFDFKYNAVGQPPQNDSALSPEYTLRILEP